MSDMRDLDWRLIDAFLAGEATPEQVRTVEEWMATSADNRALIESLRASTKAPAVVDVDAAWQKLQQRIGQGTRVVSLDDRRRRRIYSIAAIAAAVLIIVARSRTNPMREVVGPTAPTALVTVMLPDSTQVSVGAGSRIRYRTRFTTRDVELIGDAEFRVKHDAARPFRVRTASAVVTDLGTLFFVRSIPKGASVVVMEGKVSLRSSSAAADSVVIEKGMSGRVADNRLSLDMPHAIEDYNDWMQGYVTFRAASLGEVAEQLSHRYVTAIRVDTSLANRQVTASFRRESLDQVLTAITTALGIRYERRGDTIVVSPK